ncbi:MAG TPA: hypothetical protein VFS25_03035 [Chitinophaga sp.]|uniref:hypothetical protein n=1 Tax=Chitinophaga sp. TaxID=1869181 RepID=UPI002DBC86EB|nr:hypothetical protein [Chitinophaga sp.]HEU4551774.1 hypothetical protein [Chitinophaga sp.]
MCKYFILLLSFLCPSALFAQDGAKITILQPDITDGLKADVYQPFNGYANGINITKTVIAKNGKVEIDLKNVTPGVVKLESPLFKYKVFVQPGDKITVNAIRDKGYSFSGRNAMGQYYVMKMKPTGKTAEEDFNSMILPARSSTALWDSTLTCMEKYKLIYDKLRADGKITPELHQYFLSYVDAFMLMYTYMRFNMHLKASSAEKRLNTSLSNEVILSYLEKLYNTYDPFEPKYHSSLLWSLIAGNKLRLENYKHALATLPDSSKWKTFEDNEHIFALAPDSIQEIEMANHILFLIGYGSTEKSEIADFIQVFHQHYPKSKWNRFIDQQFETVPNVVGKLNNLDKAPYYISYDASHGGVQMVMQKKLSAINGVQDLANCCHLENPCLLTAGLPGARHVSPN